MAKSIRYIKGYPKRPSTLIRRKKRGAIKRELIRLPKPRIHANPWRLRTRLDPEAALEARAARSTIATPGSLEERIFYKALVDHGFLEGVDFIFQASQFGGRGELGGIVADFLFPEGRLIVNPSSYWHIQSLAHIRRDEEQTALLRSQGFEQILLSPHIIHDHALLDEWIERNLTRLWGMSSNGLVAGQIRDDRNIFEVEYQYILNRIDLTLDATLRELKR